MYYIVVPAIGALRSKSVLCDGGDTIYNVVTLFRVTNFVSQPNILP